MQVRLMILTDSIAKQNSNKSLCGFYVLARLDACLLGNKLIRENIPVNHVRKKNMDHISIQDVPKPMQLSQKRQTRKI